MAVAAATIHPSQHVEVATWRLWKQAWLSRIRCAPGGPITRAGDIWLQFDVPSETTDDVYRVEVNLRTDEMLCTCRACVAGRTATCKHREIVGIHLGLRREPRPFVVA